MIIQCKKQETMCNKCKMLYPQVITVKEKYTNQDNKWIENNEMIF